MKGSILTPDFELYSLCTVWNTVLKGAQITPAARSSFLYCDNCANQ